MRLSFIDVFAFRTFLIKTNKICAKILINRFSTVNSIRNIYKSNYSSLITI